MNATRRKQLREIGKLIEKLKAEVEALQTSELDEIVNKLEHLRDSENEAFENLPENFQNGSKGEGMLEAVENLEDLLDAVELIAAAMEELSSSIEDTTERIDELC